MRAAVLHGPGDLRVEERGRGSPGRGEVLVKVRAAGVCSSDFGRVREAGVRRLPLVVGHEFSGVVVQVGDGVDIAPGARVAVYPLLWCGRCESCERGLYQCCSDYSYHGSRTDGGLAEFVVTRGSNAVALPDEVSDEEGAMTEPAAVALHALNRAGKHPGERIVVLGAGAIGLIAAQIARARGARSVVILDIIEQKLEVARRLGFDKVALAEGDDVAATVSDLAGGPAELVLEAAGSPVSCNLAVELAARRGSVVLIGNINADLTMPQRRVSSILRKELRILGTWNSNIGQPENEWDAVLEMVRRRQVALSPLISHRLPLDELPGVVQRVINRDEAAGKVMVTFPE